MTKLRERGSKQLASGREWRLGGAAITPAPAITVPGTAALAAIAEWIAARRGLARLVLAAAAGALAALAMAPFHVVPALFVAFTVLTWQLDGLGRYGRRLGVAALIGWAFGAGFFAVGLHWVGNAFLVDEATFGKLLPAAMAAIALGLGLFPAAAAGAARLFWSHRPSRILVLALAWSASEWLRGHILTGFPWNFAGHIWGATLSMLQVTSLIGIYGLSLLTALAAAAPASLVDFRSGRGAAAPLGALLWPLLAAVVLASAYAFGTVRLNQPQTPDIAGVKLRLVQPSVPQREKITRGTAPRIFAEHMALMQKPGADGITHFIWPEAAVPVLLAQDSGALAAIADTLRPGQWLIAGAARYEPADGALPERYFNSLHVISDEGAIVASYDKHHLVPFGEYLPLTDVLSLVGLRQLVENETGFTPGLDLHTLSVPGARDMGPLICYEAIFPGAVSDPERRPGWLLNITDDTWFGLGAGPYQHFENARVRTIEEGLPLVRAANNGISAIVDAKGRVRQSLALNAVGVLDSPLPAREPPTFYARFKDLPYLFLALGLALAAFLPRPPKPEP